MNTKRKKVPAVFYRTASGNEPVGEWLKGLSQADRRIVGTDIATVEFGWPIGMPSADLSKGRKGLCEIRSDLPNNRVARVLFCIHGERLVLLHGFMKKTRKTPDEDLALAVRRKKEIEA